MIDVGHLSEVSVTLCALIMFACPWILLVKGYGRPCWFVAIGTVPAVYYDFQFKYHQYIANDMMEWLESPGASWLWMESMLVGQILLAVGLVELLRNWAVKPLAKW